MASLLKDLDKLETADNNSNKPVAEDKDNSGSLVDVYWSVEIASRDKNAP